MIDDANQPLTAEAQAARSLVAVHVPAVIRAPSRRRPLNHLLRATILVLLLTGGGAGGAYYWWRQQAAALPPGFAWGNGRLEADEIDIATKFADRVGTVLVDEGDIVKAGQVVARMEIPDLQVQLARADAGARQAEKAVDAARYSLEQRRAQVTLAQQQLSRARMLVVKGFETREVVDQRQAALDSAIAAFNAGEAQIAQAEHGLEVAKQDAALLRVNIADTVLVAPKNGRIQYRLANVGEMLAVGGKVFTMLDTGNVYMDIFLPTAQAGALRLGSDARILLDALPNQPILAKVAFLATQAQFTPKMVETRDERDKLMFRVRVRIDPALLQAHAQEVRSGLPGIAYVQLDPQAAWPASLRGASGP